ncbi:MAG: substrate-binding domain-containing protein, partial [Alteraurantiacibacter sp.]
DNALITGLLDKQKIPHVRIGSRDTGGTLSITMGDDALARLATEHLIAKGHQRIAFVAGAREYALSQWRKEGWLNTMREHGLATEGLCERGDFSFASGEKAARKLLERRDRPTAIIAGNDQMAMAANKVAHELGLKVPGDLSLISFDNTPVVRFVQPPLTAIDQPIAETVSRAVELLIKSQRGEELPPLPLIVEGSLVERQSVSSPPNPK